MKEQAKLIKGSEVWAVTKPIPDQPFRVVVILRKETGLRTINVFLREEDLFVAIDNEEVPLKGGLADIVKEVRRKQEDLMEARGRIVEDLEVDGPDAFSIKFQEGQGYLSFSRLRGVELITGQRLIQ